MYILHTFGTIFFCFLGQLASDPAVVTFKFKLFSTPKKTKKRQNTKIQRESTIFEPKCESFGAKSEQKCGFLQATFGAHFGPGLALMLDQVWRSFWTRFGAHFGPKITQNLRLSTETPSAPKPKVKARNDHFRIEKREKKSIFYQTIQAYLSTLTIWLRTEILAYLQFHVDNLPRTDGLTDRQNCANT